MEEKPIGAMGVIVVLTLTILGRVKIYV
ncbi:hypothetical protein CSW41_00395 [Thermus scotoductus]|uniref:Uncharacterized protein n=1 Tax=Thermus scotoductus TaxID=37636 RepID=A0A430RQJ6_THESC|nr:hypothetical protein CSW41_00395 [Thermus scotoductus]